MLPLANTAKVIQAVVEREDTKVGSLVERVLTRQNRGKIAPEPSRQTTEDEPVNPLAALFRSPGGSTAVAEQPDPDDLEIHDA